MRFGDREFKFQMPLVVGEISILIWKNFRRNWMKCRKSAKSQRRFSAPLF